MSKKTKVFADYIKAGGTDVPAIAAKHGISRQAVYSLVGSVRDGSVAARKTCEESVRLECLWVSKYKEWSEAIPDELRNPYVLDEYKSMLRAMKKDGFPMADMARRLGKDNATIRHHLKKA